jgi:hypothetical protein
MRHPGVEKPQPRRGRDDEDESKGDPWHALKLRRISLAL